MGADAVTDPTLIADLIRAGVMPELVARVASALTGSFADGVAAVTRNVTGDACVTVRSAGADRQARYRERHPERYKASQVTPVTSRNVTGLMAATSFLRIEESIEEEEKKEVADEESDVTPHDAPTSRTRGTKIPADWEPSEDLFDYCRQLGFSNTQTREGGLAMREWAIANSNRAVARKASWDLTFKGWMRRQQPKSGKPAIAADIEPPVWSKPPPGFKPIEEILRANGHAAANGTKLRSDSGLGENGRDQRPELPLPS